jgi:uncharacterized membrane protein YfcA
MTPLLFTVAVFSLSVAAGVLGSLLGLGGGIIIVPALTLLLHVDIRFAIGASIVSVIATSSGAAAAYVRDGMTNLRVAMFLELGTTAGALSGAYLAGVVPVRTLYLVFGVVMGYSALAMFRKRHADVAVAVPADALADRLDLHGSYVDEALGGEVHYPVTGSTIGLGLMYVAGVVSGLLGIGSGALKVPAMDVAMDLPIKVSTATSNFMIGITGLASALVYLQRGQVLVSLVAPIALGVLAGATVGTRILPRVAASTIRSWFVVVLAVIVAQMLYKGLVG